MRVLSIVHQPDAGPGVFAPVLAASGHEIEEWRPDLEPRPRAPVGEYGAALVFGGAMHVDQEARHPWLTAEKRLLGELLERGVAVLGLCLGAQLLAEAGGGGARPAPAPEIGWRELRLATEALDDPLFGALPGRLFAFEWHAYEIELPSEGVVLARSDCCLQAFRAGELAWGVQFHAEVTEETVAEWASKDGEEGELREAGLDAADLTAETARRIAESNRLGAKLCQRFLGIAATACAAAA